MKIFHTKLRNSLIISSLFFSFYIEASPVAQVVEVKGQVFSVDEKGKTTILKPNDHLEEKTEVMVEEGATITLNDYFDATYHLIGGSHLKFYKQSSQLKKGKAWIKAKNEKYKLGLTTANGLVEFNNSEFIVTFDQASAKTQVLTVDGEIEFSNILEKNVKQVVTEGQFTFIDPKMDDGIPRSATKVGLDSLNKSLAEFKGLPEEIKKEAPSSTRSIASISEPTKIENADSVAKKVGKIIYIKSDRQPASVESGKAHDYFNKLKMNTKNGPARVAQKNEIKIRYFGIKTGPLATTPKEVKPRSPASIPITLPVIPVKKNTYEEVEEDFEKSLKNHEVKQPKHSKELESLINDLKSY